MNHRLTLAMLVAALVGLSACSSPAPRAARVDPTPCNGLPAAMAALKNVRITAAQDVAADANGMPAHCQVTGLANERTGIDGRAYAIRFEMRLPAQWNQRFLHQVNGGNDGKVVPATGSLQIFGTSPLQRGFAVISSDSGHSADDPANAGAGLANSNVFGLDPQARRDYGYSADDTMFQVAQVLMLHRYGRAPMRNYIAGCSNGGRHALVDASRYGERYDGVLAGAPGLNLPKAAVQHAWDVQSWQQANPDIRQAFSPADLTLVAARVIEKCDALDGAADGIVGDLAACQRVFRIGDLQCSGAKTAQCLSAAQVGALQRSFSGPRNSRGEALYSDWSFDAGIGSANWRFWKLESSVPPWNKLPLIATMGAGSLSYIFTTPPTRTPGLPDALLKSLAEFDFDRDAPRIHATDATFRESAMGFMAPPDVDNPTLAALRSHGGKLIVYHGNSDPVFSINDTQRWFAKLAANGGNEFARLYGVPGMAHCVGGPSTDQFDALGALVAWVEQGRAPAALDAAVNPANKELPAGWSTTRSRPLCPWPQVARYTGGDIESAASFRCAAP